MKYGGYNVHIGSAVGNILDFILRSLPAHISGLLNTILHLMIW